MNVYALLFLAGHLEMFKNTYSEKKKNDAILSSVLLLC